jgi:serine/threonine protein kinase/gas vesicle protein
MSESTATLLHKSIHTGDSIIVLVTRFKHSKPICDKLCKKVATSQKFLKELKDKYDNNSEYFEMPSYNAAFRNYVSVMDSCWQFLRNFESKSLFSRLVNSDKHKKTFYRLFIDIDQAISVLNLGLSVKDSSSNQDSVQYSENEIEESRGQLSNIAQRLGSLKDDIDATGQQKEELMQEIRDVQEDRHNSEDILASVEISRRQLKLIPGLPPRQGRRYHVFKRVYLGQEVAEKIFGERIGDGKVLENVRKQVAILKKLSICPHIIQFYGVCIRGTQLGMVTEYAENGNLKDLLESKTPLDRDQLLGFSIDIAQGVAFLHEMQILHKNIKSSSVLVTADWRAKLSGFEFSREESSGTALVEDDGSDRYRWIPPEKMKDYFSFTTKADVYGIGMVLWSIWSRRYPYEILSQQTIEDFVVRGGREKIEQVPVEVSPIILACWQQDPSLRPEAPELLDELDQLASPSEGNTQLSVEVPFILDQDVTQASIDDPVSANSSTLSTATVTNGSNSHSDRPQSIDVTQKLADLTLSEIIPTHTPESPSTRSINNSASIPSAPPVSNNLPKPSAPPQDPPKQEIKPSEQFEYKMQNMMETNVYLHDEEDGDLFGAPPDNSYDTRIFDADMENLDDDIWGDEDSEPEVTLEEAVEHHSKGERAEAMRLFQILSKRGEPKADYYLGYYYFWGQDGVVEKDWDNAVHYLSKAAEHNDSDALDHLGMYYASEENPNKNLVKAFEHYKKSAELGNIKALYHVGVCYAKGRGVRMNRELAMRNITDAANRGHALAIEQLNKARRHGR